MAEETIRVLRIVSLMDRGGIETQIMNVYREINKKKIQFDFLVTREKTGVYDDEIRSLGGRIYQIPSVRKSGLLKFMKNINSFFKSHPEYKIVHCHMNSWSGLFLGIAKNNNIPIRIAQSHSAPGVKKHSSLKYYLEDKFKSFMKKFIKNNATHYWAVGEKAGEWLYGKYLFEKEGQIIPNVKKLEKYQYNVISRNTLRENLNIAEDKFVLGHVGSFTNVKNHYFLINLFNYIRETGTECVLLLVGDGELKADIKKKIDKLKYKDDIIFLGLRHDVNELMSVFDVLILPSKFEGMPNVVIEAQAASLPCVISDTITKEIDMGIDLVDYISLNKSYDEWGEAILSRKNTSRNFSQKKLKENGYDMKEFIDWLEKEYTNMLCYI